MYEDPVRSLPSTSCQKRSGGGIRRQESARQAADLVVLDMIMDPGMDGLDAYRRILEIHPHQRAIIVSGFADTERVRIAQALGAAPI